MQLTAPELEHVLDCWPVARLATLSSRGRPHVVPIVFVALDQLLYSAVDGKPKRAGTLQRLRNVAHQGAVSLLLDHYDSDWRALWWLRIDAVAEVLDVATMAAPLRERVEAKLRMKYPQYRTVPLFEGTPTLLRLRVEAHRAWSATPMQWQRVTAG